MSELFLDDLYRSEPRRKNFRANWILALRVPYGQEISLQVNKRAI